MTRRLFFIFPDRLHALDAVRELEAAQVPRTHMHAVANQGVPLDGLPAATLPQQRDRLRSVDLGLWHGNQILFWVAFALFGLSALNGSVAGMVVTAVVMAGCFLFGLQLTKLPHTHLHDLHDALAHGEIVLMVDLPKGEVHDIEQRIHHHHPEAAVGGVCWNNVAWNL